MPIPQPTNKNTVPVFALLGANRSGITRHPLFDEIDEKHSSLNEILPEDKM